MPKILSMSAPLVLYAVQDIALSVPTERLVLILCADPGYARVERARSYIRHDPWYALAEKFLPQSVTRTAVEFIGEDFGALPICASLIGM